MTRILDTIRKYWITVLIFVGIGALYVFVTETGIANPFLFPKVDAIGEAYEKNRDLLFINMFSSFKLMIPSILISLVISIGLGMLLGLNRRLREILYPVIYAFSVIPSILLSPFVLLMAPNFWVSSLFLIIYGTVWTTLFATITGIMTVDKRYLDKAKTLELTGFQRLVKVILPAASPSILSGFVSSLRGTFVMLVYAEMYGSKYGMGFFVKKYTEFGLYDNAWCGFIFLVIVLVIVMQIFELIKRRILRWTTD